MQKITDLWFEHLPDITNVKKLIDQVFEQQILHTKSASIDPGKYF